MTALVIPEPGGLLPVDFVRRARLQLEAWTDPQLVDEARRRLAALETYVRGKDAKAEIQTATRWAEVRIGELLGQVKPGERTDLGQPLNAFKGLTPEERVWFRRLAANRDLVDELIGDGCTSRSAVLNGIARRDIAARPSAVPMPADAAGYKAIVIDPPWPMVKIERHERPRQDDQLDYPTMSLEAIGDLDVAGLADPAGCHLYLWTTHKFLPAALGLTAHWGFRYQCLMTWVKNVGITPFSWMYDTEHVIFARLGALELQRKGLRLSFSAPVAGHSVKPDVFYDRVAQASPGPRLEMFARCERPDFACWGNELRHAV